MQNDAPRATQKEKRMRTLSFEFFPAKTAEGSEKLVETARNLSSFGPEFMSVTYGAGGTTKERSFATLQQLQKAVSVPLAAHLTCVGASRAEVDQVACNFWEAGIKHIVALRGDPPSRDGKAQRFAPHPEGYRNAAELVAGLQKIAPFEISVAAYPETHPDSPTMEADLENLKRKFEAGATRAITQFFFEAETFLRFRDRAAKAGITQPLIPGILPLSNVEQAWKFAAMCGASVSPAFQEIFEGLDEMPEIRSRVAIAMADRLCQRLRREGVEHFHIYTLNQTAPSAALCRLMEAA